MTQHQTYCTSRFTASRRLSRAVLVGKVGVGGENPIRVQSMTTTNTQDVDATVRQCRALAEAGCEIIRITAPNVKAAKALKDIRKQFSADGFQDIPLVADIHFLPAAAMEAVEHVEKVRVNPGNYADKKKFAVHEYTDKEYELELERLHEAFTPLVLRAKELGRALRIGTNHGSLSDRIMNRFGDSPLGMVESALEFIRIAESHRFQDIILSMKASNPKVMIEAYRLVVAKMLEENMIYPLHLGVTEAGDGDDARIKSATGIGSLLYDGLGDTIRVSLTEDPVYEIPVARDLADKAMHLWSSYAGSRLENGHEETINPYEYKRREVEEIDLGDDCRISPLDPPRVIVKTPHPIENYRDILADIARTHSRNREAKVEGLLVDLKNDEDLKAAHYLVEGIGKSVRFFVFNLLTGFPWTKLEALISLSPAKIVALLPSPGVGDIQQAIATTQTEDLWVALDVDSNFVRENESLLRQLNPRKTIFACTRANAQNHPLGQMRLLCETLAELGIKSPVWLRNTEATAIQSKGYYGDNLLEGAMYTGSLLCDGIGDLVSVETEANFLQATPLVYGLLQGARARTTKTEYVACPSCGRTLFDLQSTTQKIRARTGHLKGVTIAVMGCIVNGPGEMADADFGYVGGAPAKVNLYVGKECVKYHIPEEEAVDRLVELIKTHGKWIEPVPQEGESPSAASASLT